MNKNNNTKNFLDDLVTKVPYLTFHFSFQSKEEKKNELRELEINFKKVLLIRRYINF